MSVSLESEMYPAYKIILKKYPRVVLGIGGWDIN